MLTSLRGVYENGRVHLIEPAPATSAPVEVVVVFLEPDTSRGFVEVAAGAAADLAQNAPRNEQMARLRAAWQRAREQAPSMQGPSLSEEVMADREDVEPRP